MGYHQEVRKRLLFLAKVSHHGWATAYPAVGINHRPPPFQSKARPVTAIAKSLGLSPLKRKSPAQILASLGLPAKPDPLTMRARLLTP